MIHFHIMMNTFQVKSRNRQHVCTIAANGEERESNMPKQTTKSQTLNIFPDRLHFRLEDDTFWSNSLELPERVGDNVIHFDF